MRLHTGKMKTLRAAAVTALMLGAALCTVPALAQGPPYYGPEQLDNLVSRIALYPDPLLAQVLAAATFPDQIQDAARWADQHHYLTGDALAAAIEQDRLPWDPSVQALLPFPATLDMLASNMAWTSDLGNAFLANQQQVMDAVQRMRQRARDFGYLRSNGQVVVSGGPYIAIMPVNPAFLYVPYYDPLIVYARPRPGFFVGGAINFGFGVSIGPAFRPWGWGGNRVAWDNRTVIINNNTWNRTWVNRNTYVHNYSVPRYSGPPPAEQHQVYERSPREREAAQYGRGRVEEHRAPERRDERRGDDRRRP
jgi:Protein of unknown function (DUF3300)